MTPPVRSRVSARGPPGESPANLARESFTAPRNPTEQVLADIWQEVLRLDRVGVHDNFFELGGESILSIQITHITGVQVALF